MLCSIIITSQIKGTLLLERKHERKDENFQKVWEDKNSLKEIAKIVLAMGSVSMATLTVIVATILTESELTYRYLLKAGLVSVVFWTTLFFLLSYGLKLNKN